MEKKFINTWNLQDFEILTDDGYKDIVALHETIPYTEYIIKTANGKELHCADNHIVFLSNYTEIFVKDLLIGYKIITDEGISEIIDIINTNIEKNMYDFELSDNSNHRYYTNGILSHNTELVKTISKLFDVPMVIVGATCFTQAGYVGEDVESILSRLYQAADNDLERAERGIVFIDEIDKIAKQGDSPSITKDVSGEGVQQALLKILEGSKVKFAPTGGRKHPEKEMVEIDTKNILFICSGAFVGIEKRIEKRLNMRAIGFAADTKKNVSKENIIEYLTPEDVRAYGMIPELVGRLPIITYVKNLTREELRQVLTEPKNSIIKQYTKLFKMDGVKLEFENDALDYIVEKAMTLKTGARGLRSIVEEIMTQYMYDIPSTKKRKLVVTKEYAEEMYEAKQAYRASANN